MSKKRMTVELRDPFVWPEVPEDLSAYVYPLSALLFHTGWC